MQFWNSSALVACFIIEKETEKIRAFTIASGETYSYMSIITPLEVESAIQRKLMERSITSVQADAARFVVSEFRKQSYLVVADQNVLDMALHIQKIYSLRVADSLQLASARMGTENPAIVNFLSMDRLLNEAAKREGFNVPF